MATGDSGTPSLVQPVTSAASRLLFMASENGGDYVEKECFVLENLLY